jgi:rhodanese-related sulfurtransferase
MSIPGITPRDLAVKLKSESSFVLLDVRELWELSYARIDDPRLVILPISQLAHARESALPESLVSNFEAEIVVLCHHGIRSADVTRWLITQGWKNTVSLEGGIAAYASEVDKSVGWY